VRHMNKLTNLYIFRDVNNITTEGAGFQFVFVTNILLAVFFCLSRNKGKIDLLNFLGRFQ
jgi:hypothetical protein